MRIDTKPTDSLTGKEYEKFFEVFAENLFKFQAKYYEPLPFIVYGSLALVGGVLTVFLPETTNRKLPDTVSDFLSIGNVVRREKKSHFIQFFLLSACRLKMQ